MRNLTKLEIITSEITPELREELDGLFDDALVILKKVSAGMLDNSISGVSISDHMLIASLILKYHEDKLLTNEEGTELNGTEIMEAIDSLNDSDEDESNGVLQ